MGVAQNTHVRRPSSQIKDRRLFLDLQGIQSLSGNWSGFRNLPDRAVGAQQLRKFYLFQIVADVAPGIPAALLGHALQKQGQHTQTDMGTNAMRRPVIDGT